MYWIDEAFPVFNRRIAFICDTEDDINNLPTTTTSGQQQGDDTSSCKPCGKGSRVFVLENGKTYYLQSDDDWVAPGNQGGGTGGIAV